MYIYIEGGGNDNQFMGFYKLINIIYMFM
jgi:hypothetical protein